MNIEERNKIVLDNLNLVHFCLKKLNIPLYSCEYDDAYQEGCIGLIRAVELYDETIGTAFSSYAFLAICNKVKCYWRNKRKEIAPSINDEDTIKAGWERYIRYHSLDKVEDQVIKEYEIKEMREKFQSFNSKYKPFLLDYYYNDLSGLEISKKYGFSNMKSAYESLKNALNEFKYYYKTGRYKTKRTDKQEGKYWKIYLKQNKEASDKGEKCT